MGKYEELAVLKPTRARQPHVCDACSGAIRAGDTYYREHIQDKFLHTLHARKFCTACYERYAEGLLVREKRKARRGEAEGSSSEPAPQQLWLMSPGTKDSVPEEDQQDPK